MNKTEKKRICITTNVFVFCLFVFVIIVVVLAYSIDHFQIAANELFLLLLCAFFQEQQMQNVEACWWKR